MEQSRLQSAVGAGYRYYEADGKSVNPELFSTIADTVGKELTRPGSKLKGRGDIQISPTQLRRFFDDVKAIQRYLGQFHGMDEREAAFRKKLPEIKMLKAKAAYARGRDTVTQGFLDFVDKNVNMIKEIKDFDVFCKFFEAVYGYFYFHSPKNR